MPGRLDANRLRMRALAVGLPDQLVRGFRLGHELEPRLPPDTRSALIVGMGGSAIAGDLLESVTRSETDWLLTTLRGANLPRSLPLSGIVLFVSYSGNTRETLAAYEAARVRNLRAVTLSAGGQLAESAERDGVPHVMVPPGLPPRGALGLLLGAVMGVLDAGFPESFEPRISAISDRLRARQAEFASPRGGPARLARRIGGRTPTFLAHEEVAAVARRWMTQVEENAKRLAHFESLPEAFHNAIVPWDRIRRSEARRHAVVLLDVVPQSPADRSATAYLSRLLERKGLRFERVDLGIEDRLEAILSMVSYGDHFSLSLAESAGIDPLEIHAIDRLKRAGRSPEAGLPSPL